MLYLILKLPAMKPSVFFLFAAALISAAFAPPKEKKLVIGYVFGRKPLDMTLIDAHKLTHINYAFAVIEGTEVVPSNGNRHDSINIPALIALKRQNPDLQILISIGGWGGSGAFSDAALTPESRSAFTRSAISYMQRWGFDGIDIDWEYPGQPGAGNPYRAEDKQHFTLMLQSLREGLDSLARITGETHYALTIAAGAGARFLEHTDMAEAARYLDFINIMTYDFTGSWSLRTGHHTNLFASTTGPGSVTDTRKSVDLMLAQGIPAGKLVIGAAFYGKSWRLGSSNGHGLNTDALSAGREFRYHEIRDSLLAKAGYQRHWDAEARAPYLFHPDSLVFVTYDDPKSIRHKVKYVRKHGRRGVMSWEYYGDRRGELVGVMDRAR